MLKRLPVFILFILLSAISVAFCAEMGNPNGGNEINLWRLLDYGALGSFTIYLILEHRRRDKKDQETSKRFADMDRDIVNATKDTSVAMHVMTTAANGLKAAVDNLTNLLYTKPCLRPKGVKTRETDVIE